MTERLKKRVEACEMKILRKTEGVTRLDKIKSDGIRKRLRVREITRKIKKIKKQQ